MVRDIRAVMTSMEKIFRANNGHQSIQNHSEMRGTSTLKRCQEWLGSQPVGLALERFDQMFLEKISDKCLFVRAEDLTENPIGEMLRVYEYLGLPYYHHDFDNVEQTTIEDDEVYGLSSCLHKIRKEVRPLKRDGLEVLGSETCEWLNQTCYKYQERFNYA